MRGVIWGFLLLATFTFAQNKSGNEVNNDFKDHSLKQINCKTCHSCDVPTKQVPCLNPCPRDFMITVNQTPEEGPETVTLDELSNKDATIIILQDQFCHA